MPIMKLAGHLPLQDMIAQTIDTARAQMSASSEKRASAAPAGRRVPAKTKVAGPVIDFSDPDQIEKLASALESVGDDLTGDATPLEFDGQAGPFAGAFSSKTGSIKLGGHPCELHEMPNPVKGKRPMLVELTAAEAKKFGYGQHSRVTGPEEEAHWKARAASAQKTAAADSVMAKIETKKKAKKEEEEEEKEKTSTLAGSALLAVARHPHLAAAGTGGVIGAATGAATSKKGHRLEGALKGGAGGAALGAAGSHLGAAIAEKGALDIMSGAHALDSLPKLASALDFLTSKLAESAQGGETLDSASGSGPKPPSNPGREYIESNSAATNMKKVDGKAPQKRLLSEVLTEPALSKSTDSKVQDNLRNASKGGVKIAAARAFLQKIASDPSDPRHKKMKEAFAKAKEKKAIGGMGTSPMSSGGMPPPMAGM